MPLLEGIGTAYLRLSKYISKAAKKRIPLHRKNAGKGFYKGTGCAPTGRLTSLGKSLQFKGSSRISHSSCEGAIFDEAR